MFWDTEVLNLNFFLNNFLHFVPKLMLLIYKKKFFLTMSTFSNKFLEVNFKNRLEPFRHFSYEDKSKLYKVQLYNYVHLQ